MSRAVDVPSSPIGPPLRPHAGLTLNQEATVRAYLAEGSIKGASRLLGVPDATVRSRLHGARRRAGLPSIAHLCYWLDRR